MTHIDRVGDKFQRRDCIVEIIEVNDNYTRWKVVYSDDVLDVDNEIKTSPRDEGWERWGYKYLGNFNKSKNFNSLYEKLNGGVQEGG